MNWHRIKALRLHHRKKSQDFMEGGDADYLWNYMHDTARGYYENPNDAADYANFHHQWAQTHPEQAISHFNAHLGRGVAHRSASDVRPGDSVYHPEWGRSYYIANIRNGPYPHRVMWDMEDVEDPSDMIENWAVERKEPHIVTYDLANRDDLQPQEPKVKSFGSGDELLDTLYDQALPHYENPDDAHDYVEIHYRLMQDDPAFAIQHFNEHLGRRVSRHNTLYHAKPGDRVSNLSYAIPGESDSYHTYHVVSVDNPDEYKDYRRSVTVDKIHPNKRRFTFNTAAEDDDDLIISSEIPKTNQPQEPK